MAMKTNAKSLKATKALAGKVEMPRNVTVWLDTLHSINQKVKKPKIRIIIPETYIKTVALKIFNFSAH